MFGSLWDGTLVRFYLGEYVAWDLMRKERRFSLSGREYLLGSVRERILLDSVDEGTLVRIYLRRKAGLVLSEQEQWLESVWRERWLEHWNAGREHWLRYNRESCDTTHRGCVVSRRACLGPGR